MRLRGQDRCRIKVIIRVVFESGLELELVLKVRFMVKVEFTLTIRTRVSFQDSICV